jgi:hypothetical protein
MSRVGKSQPEWMAALRKGDVLVSATGSYRVVRDALHYGKRLGSVAFTIMHPSWTGRCYTILNSNDLLQRGFRPVGARIKLASRFDAIIEVEIRSKRKPLLGPEDVRGVA